MSDIPQRHADPVTLDHLVRLSAAVARYEQALERIRDCCDLLPDGDIMHVVQAIDEIAEQALERGAVT